MTAGISDYTTPTMPPNGEIYQFGTPFATFASAPKRTGMRNFWIFLLLAGETALFTVAMSPYFENEDLQIGVFIGGVCVGLLGLLGLFSWWRYRQTRVLLFDQGFTQIIKGEMNDVRWNEINAVWQNVTKHYTNGVYTRTTHVYTLQTTTGKRFVWNDAIKNVEQLGIAMQNAVTKIRLPEVQSAYQAGQTITFGPLSVSLAGLSKGNQTVSWTEIKGVQVEKGYIRVKKQDAWFNFAKVATSSIPNLFIFLTLVDQIIGINPGKK
jgi:hypothetical protein